MTHLCRDRIDHGLSVCIVTAVLFLLNCPIVSAKTPTQVSTLDELVKMFDSSSCKECHKEIYEQWKKSHHARPLAGFSRVARSLNPAQRALGRDFPCFKCHYPQIKHTTDGVAKDIIRVIGEGDRSTVNKLNIGCLVCHNEKAIAHGRPEKGVVYGNKESPDQEGHPVKRSPLLKSSLMCGQCHGLGPVLDSPDMPVQCATLYGSYLHAYIASGGTKTCQECHMKNGDHHMPPDFNNRADLSARLKESLPMEVQTLGYTFPPSGGKFFPMVVVKTKITSKAGHRIPDG